MERIISERSVVVEIILGSIIYQPILLEHAALPRDALLPQQNGESRMNNDRRILDYTPFCIQFCGVLGILCDPTLWRLVGSRIPNTQNCQQITNESPRAPRNLTPPGSSDKPTWRCQQIPLIGALGIQVICYPRRAFQERLINDRKVEDGSTPGSWRGRGWSKITLSLPHLFSRWVATSWCCWKVATSPAVELQFSFSFSLTCAHRCHTFAL